jgi:PBP4 family serine-type D-alanyl-D-alanine carboxypeptidase
MVKFAILWSDNQLADRLVREAARHENLPTDQPGLQKVVETSLRAYGISTEKLFIVDGAGLAKENMVTPRTIIQVLMTVRNNPNFQAIYEGLPVSGQTGTLKNRFLTTGTNAVGLVRAKTGWLNSVVSLAGYVTVGKNEYVFAIIADHITPGFKYRNRARETIYSLLGTIATPLN